MPDPAPRSSRLRTTVMVVLAFAVGAAAGVLVTTAAATRAVHTTVGAARGLFVYDQGQRMAIAWNEKAPAEALAYARCAYEAEFAEGARWFDKAVEDWSVWGGAFLQVAVVEPNRATSDKVRPLTEGMALARIAVVLEQLGREQEAQNRLAQAIKVGGRDADYWRKLGLATVAQTLPEGFLHPDGSVRK